VDVENLQRELDRVKSKVFLGKNAAFLGSLLCSLNFIWDESTETAATNGLSFWWNPNWFLELPPATRETVLLHELWHPGRLHMIRRGNRDPEIWNYACDIRINNDLENEGHSFVGAEDCWKDQSFGNMVEEDIYDFLIQNQKPPPPNGGSWGAKDKGGDITLLDQKQIVSAVNNVVRAIQQAKMAGDAGAIPGGIETIIEKFLAPIVPWEQHLNQFFTDLCDEDYSWKRPNRRHIGDDLYLPSRIRDDGKLEHLAYYLDVSGSVSNADVLRFNSEVKYIKEFFNPEKLTLVLFDTRITATYEFSPEDTFEKIVVVGRGGTSLVPVREHIQEHKPTAAVIFSDLQCPQMQPLDFQIPVLWVAIRAAGKTVPFGKLIHIRN
jgi:predicted metal-dependent peptidase